jgi:hypothetical protein
MERGKYSSLAITPSMTDIYLAGARSDFGEPIITRAGSTDLLMRREVRA